MSVQKQLESVSREGWTGATDYEHVFPVSVTSNVDAVTLKKTSEKRVNKKTVVYLCLNSKTYKNKETV
jgi:hypothetical protein